MGDRLTLVEFREKIARLVDARSKVELSRRAGLPASTLDAIINKGREPLARKAVKLARLFQVPVDWLFDDDADWPPPDTSPFDLASVSDDEIARSFRQRTQRSIEWLRGEGMIDPADLDRAESLASNPATKDDRFVFSILMKVLEHTHTAMRLHLQLRWVFEAPEIDTHELDKYPHLRDRLIEFREQMQAGEVVKPT